MRISDWSSDVCSSDLLARAVASQPEGLEVPAHVVPRAEQRRELGTDAYHGGVVYERHACLDPGRFHQGLLERVLAAGATVVGQCPVRSEEHPSELQSLMRISYAVFCLKKKKDTKQ